jgi:histidyl-tRNA synthetase
MSTKAKFQAIRGTRDLLPPDTALWNRVEQTAHEVFTTYGYGEIRPPIFENLELFARSVGSESDIVSKEMYSLLDPPTWPEILQKLGSVQDYDRAETTFEIKQDLVQSVWMAEILALRPEATASVCRAYIEQGMQQMPQPVKLYYMGPMFRRERPQKGRYRQFYQIGAEILGGPDAPAIDAELIEMLMTFFDKCGLQGTELSINSIGHAADNCRRGYVALLRAELEKVKDKLGADSQRRIETNPLRVLDSKLDHEQAIIATLPRIADHLCDECKTHYAAVKRDLDLRGVKYHENWRLVRGLDYYMRTTFEITAPGLGSQNAVCGGGRYDGLVELLGGPPTKGIGFAIGEDRLILSLQEGGKGAAPQGRDVFIAWMGQNAYATAVRAAKTLRNAGFRVELPATELKFGKALERASKLGSRFALILGDNEIQSGEWTLKNLANAEQQKLTEPALLDYLKSL